MPHHITKNRAGLIGMPEELMELSPPVQGHPVTKLQNAIMKLQYRAVEKHR